MKKHKNIFIALAVSVVMVAGSALAQTVAGVNYPIAPLGGCTDKADCRDYCGKPDNMKECVMYAEQAGLLSGEDLRISKIVAEKISKKETPGGCATKDSCELYCQGNVERLNECISFGENLGIIPPEDLAEAKKIMNALKSGAKMPGNCKEKHQCEQYCAAPAHIEECLDFAEASGIISAEEIAEARKVAPFLKNGETPGACTTKKACKEYCDNDANFNECIGFAEKAGFVSGEEATLAKKVGGKGPGGCKGKEACTNFCNDEANAAECANFAKEKGLLTAEQEENLNTGMDRLKAGLEQIPEEAKGEVVACLENAVGKEKLARLLSKQDVPTQAMGDKIQLCFANIAQIMQVKMMQGGGGGGAGPGAMPAKEDIMKNLPDNIPPEMRAKIESQIETQMPKNIPTGAGGPPAGMGMGGASTGGAVAAPPPPSVTTPKVDCGAFAAMPSADFCSRVPAGVQDACRKCKGG